MRIMVNAYGQARRHPLLLSPTVAPIFSSVISAGHGSEDDCATLRLYLLGRINTSAEFQNNIDIKNQPTSVPASAITTSTVRNILRGVHLVAAAEVISFACQLNLDLKVFHDFVKYEAGSSVMFQKYSSQLLQTNSSTTSKLIDGNEEVLSELVRKLNDHQE
jgi:3-hydroxyisobutyrate dehydrogenase